MSSNSGIGLTTTIRSINNIRSRALARRHELKLSQTELANQTGVSRKWVSSFEKGSARAELELVIRLIDTLGLDLVIVDRTPSKSVSADEYLDEKDSEGQQKLIQIDLKEILGKQK